MLTEGSFPTLTGPKEHKPRVTQAQRGTGPKDIQGPMNMER